MQEGEYIMVPAPPVSTDVVVGGLDIRVRYVPRQSARQSGVIPTGVDYVVERRDAATGEWVKQHNILAVKFEVSNDKGDCFVPRWTITTFELPS